MIDISRLQFWEYWTHRSRRKYITGPKESLINQNKVEVAVTREDVGSTVVYNYGNVNITYTWIIHNLDQISSIIIMYSRS